MLDGGYMATKRCKDVFIHRTPPPSRTYVRRKLYKFTKIEFGEVVVLKFIKMKKRDRKRRR